MASDNDNWEDSGGYSKEFQDAIKDLRLLDPNRFIKVRDLAPNKFSSSSSGRFTSNNVNLGGGQSLDYNSEVEFEQDGCHKLPSDQFVSIYSTHDDTLWVTDLRTGKRYQLSLSYAAQQGLHEEKPATPPRPRHEERVHVMHRGLPLCGFTRERPVDWPKGHSQMSVEAFKEEEIRTQRVFSVNMCKQCVEQFRMKGLQNA